MQEILFIAQKIMHAVVFVSKKSRAFERKCPDQVLRKCRLSTLQKIKIAFEIFNSSSIDCHISHTNLSVTFHYIHSVKLSLISIFFRLLRFSLILLQIVICHVITDAMKKDSHL